MYIPANFISSRSLMWSRYLRPNTKGITKWIKDTVKVIFPTQNWSDMLAGFEKRSQKVEEPRACTKKMIDDFVGVYEEELNNLRLDRVSQRNFPFYMNKL